MIEEILNDIDHIKWLCMNTNTPTFKLVNYLISLEQKIISLETEEEND